MAAGPKSVSDWDFRGSYVQNNVDPGGSFVRGGSVLLAAGPPSLTQSSLSIADVTNGFVGGAQQTENDLNLAYPIGLVDNFGLGQSKGLQQIFEIGSERRYFIPGRTVNSFSMSRVMFDGPSLMKVLYNYYVPSDRNYNSPNDLLRTGARDKDQTFSLVRQPGFDQTFLNLASELFDRPIGLLMLVHNLNDEGISAVYLEYCFLSAHQMNISSASTLFAESIQGQFDRVVPINMNFERLFG
jgi:hypothetical protein